MATESQLRTLVDDRVMVTVTTNGESPGGEENWGYIESFNDRTFRLRLEEGMYDYWVFPISVIPDDWEFRTGKRMHLILDTVCVGVHGEDLGPQTGELDSGVGIYDVSGGEYGEVF